MHYFGDSTVDDFACQICNSRTTCSKRVRFVTFPQTLVAVLVREVVCNDWVARKLEIDLKLTEEPIDFERFKADGL
jgi:uncharacterized UBP type Zn finger protein